MQMLTAFDARKLSVAEYAALTLMAVASAAVATLLNKYFPLPQAVFLACWCLVVVLLSLALARSMGNAWQSKNLPAKLFVGFLLIAIFISALKPTSTGFSRHDEIYSWGMWGVQHALGKQPDLYYTGAAYPQFFSYEIASVFLAQGTHFSHFFAKLIAGLPSLLIIIVLGDFVAKSQRSWVNWLTLLLSIGAIASIANLLYWAYADPLASALLITSLALILQYARRRELRLMVLASACALMAALTKQPGLVWCFASLPAMAAYGVWRLGWKKEVLAPCIAAMALAAIWPVFLAPSFASNQGVMDIVTKNGGIVDSVFKSVKTYVLASPGIGFILILPVLLAFRSKPLRFSWLFFVFPYLIIWFALGSYELRHGMHVILMSVLLVMHALTSQYPLVENPASAQQGSGMIERHWMACVSFLLVILSMFLAYHRNADALKDGNRAIFISQFGSDAAEVFDGIVGSQSHVFAFSNYQYGIFFNRTPLFRLDAKEKNVSVQTLRSHLLTSRSAYVFTAGDWDYGSFSANFQALSQMCPEALQLMKKSEVQPQFSIYRVHQESLLSRCQP
ncbi:hypothetical protein [Comamonas endophytica]|uniref:Dolichyl-phosphate-mannose-protein mannosyltransferase n=1 Tax=Comamonas endophytica TaxID=2949090 RepID=A0ABY6G6F7_9BURK|nr:MULTISPECIES: hypothetical protein [unclassified Acidovorax]MCD2511089.1 hypothetical protein [Acidovorax sp. D4N7]UYG50493.1 hypothetical protein M9799_10305 [Acidovorax sp. 5MLIR]